MLMLTISGILAFVFVSKRICCGRTYSYLGGDAYSVEKNGKGDGDRWDGEQRGKMILGMFEEGKNANSFCGATYGSLWNIQDHRRPQERGYVIGHDEKRI
jgi:hypothetical protein